MATRGDIVVTLDGEVVAADRPVASADDPMFARGDGVFETLLVRDGRACLIDAHLERMARSARIIGLPPSESARWRAAAAIAAAAWTDGDEAVLRLMFGRTRGGAPAGFVVASTLPDRALASRRDGVSAITLDRGVTPVGGAPEPWSIAAAKSLSYAVNAAALRHAQRLGAGDVVLMSADGFVLEGPRSSVVIARADGMLVTPPTTMPILAGTTVRAVLDEYRRRGGAIGMAPLRIGDLAAAQGVWLLSSITLAARVHTLDGEALPAVTDAFDMAAIVDAAVGRSA